MRNVPGVVVRFLGADGGVEGFVDYLGECPLCGFAFI